VNGGALRAPNPHTFVRAQPDAETAVREPDHTSSIVVLTAAKDGAGVTTLAAHIAIAALRQGMTAGVVDLDFRDRALTRWLKRRARRDAGEDALVMPAVIEREHCDEAGERARLPAALDAMRRACALVVVNAPAGAGPLARDAIARADRVITLLPDSAVEVDRVWVVDSSAQDAGRPSAYARMIWDERLDRARRQTCALDWRIVRSRALPGRLGGARLDEAERRLGALPAPAMYEAADWRLGFDVGLTGVDEQPAVTDASAAGVASADLVSTAIPMASVARDMVRDLLITLQLPGLEGARLAL